MHFQKNYLDTTLIPHSIFAKNKINILIDEILYIEKRNCLRQRKRRPIDLQHFQQLATIFFCNLYILIIRGEKKSINISRSHRNMYLTVGFPESIVYTKNLTVFLNLISNENVGYISQKIGGRNFKENHIVDKITTVYPTNKLINLVILSKLTLNDFISDPLNKETIIFKKRKENYYDEKKRVKTPTNPITKHYRQELSKINSYLLNGNIEILNGNSYRRLIPEEIILKRHFAGDAFSGGRIFGAIWQNMKKKSRKNLRINGSTTVCLDYKQTNPSLLYAMMGLEPPITDCYLIAGLEEYRAAIKKIFNAMLFVKNPLKQYPDEVKELLSDTDIRLKEIQNLIIQKNIIISKYFYTGIGYNLQFYESEILITVLNQLNQNNIIALPIHDAIIVAIEHQSIATEVMQNVYKEKMGVGINVKLDIYK